MAHSAIRDSGFDVALAILKRRKWVGVTALAATLSIALPFVFYLPDVYRGEATVIIENPDASSAFVPGAVPDLETRLITMQQELLSRSRLTDLIAELNLYPSLRRGTSMEALVQRMRRDVHVELSRSDRGRATTIGLKISYIGMDPRSAAAVPNTLATLYVNENTKIRERHTAQMAEFLKGQLFSTRQAVDLQQARLNRFKEARAGQLPEQLSINMVALERLNERLRLNLDDQVKIRRHQDRLGGATPAADEAADPLQILKQRLAELQSKFTDKHPDVIRTKAQIAEMERQRATPPSRPAPPKIESAASVDPELNALQREERTLRSEIAGYEQRLQSTPRVEQELEALQRDYNLAKDSYDSLRKRYEEAQLADSLEQTKKTELFRILDGAIVPTFPAAPNRMRLMLMACFFAVAFAIGMMLLTEHLDTSFHTVGELRQFTTVPVLASIPYVPTRTTVITALRIVLSVAAIAGLCVLLAGFAYRTARENTQLVWMLSAPRV
jgi:polysaccharide biosynthesis transport protein